MINDEERKVTLEKWFLEIQKADARLRTFPDGNGRPNLSKPRAAAMRWAIALSEKNLDILSEGDFANLQRELACLSRFEMKEPYLPAISAAGPWPSREVLVNTQQWLRLTLRSVVSRISFTYRAPERVWHLVWDSEGHEWSRRYTEKQVEGSYMVNPLFDLTREHLDDIFRCRRDDCQKIFLRDRSNQEFCSRRCQWRHSQREAQKISPDRFGKRGRPPGAPKPQKKIANKGKGGGKHGTKR